MKKSDIILIVAVLLIVVVGVFAFGKTEAKKVDYELPFVLADEAGLIELSYTEYSEKIELGEPFIVIIERESCSYCQTFLPVAETFANEYSIPLYYVDTDTFSQDEFNALVSSNSFFKEKSNTGWGTPTTIILVGSDAVDYYEGATDSDGLYKFLSDYIEI